MKISHNLNKPLVTIAVISYNSSKFIIDTLESVKNQKYKNMELIISDDSSDDDTVEKCKEWVKNNKTNFVNVSIIESISNTGIAGNKNRAIKAAHGLWLKSIAGDDVLLENCLNDNVKYIKEHPDIKMLFSKIIGFKKYANETKEIFNIFTYRQQYFELTAEQQYKQLLKDSFVPAASSFLNIETIRSLDFFDEDIPLLEDYPFWLKACKEGIKLHFMNINTVRYRIHDNNISKSSNKSFSNIHFFQSEMLFFKKYFKNVEGIELSLYKFDRLIKLSIKYLVIYLGNKEYIYKLFYPLIFFSPITWLKLYNKLLGNHKGKLC